MRRQHAPVGIERIDAKVFRTADHAPFAQPLNHVLVAATTDLGVASDAADRLFALVSVTTLQKVCDALFCDDVRDVVAVDHHRREIEV